VVPEAPHLTTVAVLGFGSIGRRHAGILTQLGCRVRGYDPVADPASTPNVEPAADVEEALAGADAAVIASPTSVHLEQAALALERGCHVLVEKPLATSADGVAALVERAEQQGRLLAVAMNLRFHPGPRGVKRVVEEGAIGRPLFAHFTFGSYLPDWRPGHDYRDGYSARRELGGGVLLDVIHEIDYGVWLLGGVHAVSASVGHVSDLEIDVEDFALLQLAFESGAHASMDLDYVDRSYRRGCRIVGSEGSVAWSWHEQHIVVYAPRGEEDVRRTPSDITSSYVEQMESFVGAVRDGATSTDGLPLVSGAEALEVLAVVDAARESAASGRRVELPRTAPLPT
jgi:predicted dehydrogenase